MIHNDFTKNFKLHKVITVLGILMLIAFLMIMLSIIHFRDNVYIMCAIVLVIFGAAFLASIILSRKLQYIITDSEAACNMLSSILTADSLFLLVFDQNSRLIHCDTRYYNHFSRKSISGTTELQKIFSSFQITGEDSQKIENLINRSRYRDTHKGAKFEEIKSVYASPVNYMDDQYSLVALPLQNLYESHTALILRKLDKTLSIAIQMEQSHIGYYRLDQRGNVVDCNQYFAKILGYDLEEVLVSRFTLSDLLDPDNSLITSPKRVDTFKENWQGFLTMKSKYGELIHTFILQKAEFGIYGELTRITGYVIKLQDPSIVLKSRGVEKGWIDYSWKCFFENSPYPVSVLDKAGKVLRINHSFGELLPDDYVGKSFEDIFSLPDRELVRTEIEDIMTRGKEVKPMKALKIDGNNRLVDVYLGKILDLRGGTFGFMVRIADVTEHKELEETLSHAQRMQTIGQLTGAIAHDFNNILTAITGFCDLLLMKHGIGDPSYANLMQIKQSADKATNLIARLLAFSRKQTMRMRIVTLNELFVDLFIIVQRLVGTDINFTHDIEAGVWPVKIDPVQMEQVILNLTVNAHHAMSHGGTLTIKARNIILKGDNKAFIGYSRPAGEALPPAGEYVCIEVSDSGSGIHESIILKIFEPFFTTKSDKLGTGLGLSTVYGIVRQSEGYIMVKSVVGKGTVFVLYFPRYIPDAADELQENELHTEKVKELSEDMTGSGVIALVEDEESIRLLAKSVLMSKGYEVIEFESAKVALENIENKLHHIDLIISDVIMPEMTGPVFVTEVRKLYPNMKIIFISGYGEDAFTEEYGDRRDFHFISKPFSLKTLVAKVKEVIESQ